MNYYLYAFGSNGESQLGLGNACDKVQQPMLVPNSPLPSRKQEQGFRSITGGGNHTLIQTYSGDVWAAGSNEDGQLGYWVKQVEKYSKEGKRLIEFDKLWHKISFCAAGLHSTALIQNEFTEHNKTGEAALYTVGRASFSELARGPEKMTTPSGVVDVGFPAPIVDLAAGNWHHVAVLDNGEVWGWGKSQSGQLGGKLAKRPVDTPNKIEEVTFKAKRAVCGCEFTYIVGDPSSGEHVVLGSNRHGLQSKMPADAKDWIDIGATWNAIFVLKQDGQLEAWGKENQWILVPEDLPLITKIAVGSDHILALTEERKLIAWGWATHGNCGDASELQNVNGFLKGKWNEIDIPGDIRLIGAGHSTSFVLTACESPAVGQVHSDLETSAE
ncbi:RCC1/BLIP-II [Zopfia rhizophila CBS 207.26]|uniref:RCC1/BLIP-II n=1 Tax=Zopfia rhizophila CBS 207.26 TaxID=1314779 RepID=A0A6A6EI75_9PEZI|nr:RCC1/BLIP-II [Zopfia rhizophila CBS 207.26]